MIFKSKQAENLEQAFKEFTAKKLKQQERPSIRKTLAVLKEKAAARSSQQAKEKIKERGPVSYTHLDVYKRQGLLIVAVGACSAVFVAELVLMVVR